MIAMRARTIILVGLTTAALVFVVLPLWAQISWVKGFKIFEHYEQGDLPPGRSSQLKSLFIASEAQPHLDGTATAKEVRIETYQPDGRTNFIAVAPACIADLKQRTASSAGRLEAASGDKRFLIEGDGFLCQLTNNYIRISNNVRALIRKDVAWPKPPPP